METGDGEESGGSQVSGSPNWLVPDTSPGRRTGLVRRPQLSCGGGGDFGAVRENPSRLVGRPQVRSELEVSSLAVSLSREAVNSKKAETCRQSMENLNI